MNYKEFQKEILRIIRDVMEINYEVNLHKVMKNNDMEMVAITIHERNVEGAVPTIYLEDFYEMYCAGVSIENIANNIIAVYHKQNGKVRISVDDFKHFDKIKDKIMLKLVNYERNLQGLETTPHKRILDLAVVFYVLWDEVGEQRMTSTVKESHLKLWNVDVDEMYRIAYENTICKLSVNIRNMKDVIYDIYTEMKMDNRITPSMEKELLTELEESVYPMYVVTNQKKILGASVILYDQALKYFYEKFNGEFYILPSSIHEVIVIPEINMSVEEMKRLVTETNENEVNYLEILSDNVYRYDGDKLVMAGMM